MLAGRLIDLRRRTMLNRSVCRAVMAMTAPASMPSSSPRRPASASPPAVVRASTPVHSDPSRIGTQERTPEPAGSVTTRRSANARPARVPSTGSPVGRSACWPRSGTG